MQKVKMTFIQNVVVNNFIMYILATQRIKYKISRLHVLYIVYAQIYTYIVAFCKRHITHYHEIPRSVPSHTVHAGNIKPW